MRRLVRLLFMVGWISLLVGLPAYLDHPSLVGMAAMAFASAIMLRATL